MAKELDQHSNRWPISKAKANFAAFLRAAEDEPQVITVRGVEKAVFLSKAEIGRLGVHHLLNAEKS